MHGSVRCPPPHSLIRRGGHRFCRIPARPGGRIGGFAPRPEPIGEAPATALLRSTVAGAASSAKRFAGAFPGGSLYP